MIQNWIYGKSWKQYADNVEFTITNPIQHESNTNMVNFKKLIDELWKLKLYEEKDKMKKTFACINIGLQEKQSSSEKDPQGHRFFLA